MHEVEDAHSRGTHGNGAPQSPSTFTSHLRQSFAGVQGPHSPGAMRRTRRRHDHTTHAWYRHDFTRMVRGRCAAPAVYRSCSMVRGRCAAPVHYWSYTIPLFPPTRSTLACSGATPVPLSVRSASLVRRGAPDGAARNPRGRHARARGSSSRSIRGRCVRRRRATGAARPPLNCFSLTQVW